MGYMEKDVLEEGVDDIPVWKEEVAAEAKFSDELNAEQLGQVKEVLKEYHEQSIFTNTVNLLNQQSAGKNPPDAASHQNCMERLDL